MKKFLSIKEFSELSEIETSTLRYWDEIGLFSPIKRDPGNNYRYYSPEQIIAVNFITVLSNLNVPLKTISKLEKDRNPEKIVRLIEKQEKLLDLEMCRLRECYSVIHSRRELLNYGMKVVAGFKAVNGKEVDNEYTAKNAIDVDVNKISILHRDDKAIILGPRNEFKEGEGFYKSFINFCKHAKDLRINLNFPIGGYHDNMESFLKNPAGPDYFCSLDPTGNRKRTAGDYLVGFAQGYYGELGNLAERMLNYAKRNSLKLTGPVYSMYLLDEICFEDISKYLIQVCVAVGKE